jgi:hypothetical protein
MGGLLLQELGPVDEQAVDNGDIVEIAELVDERPDDGQVEADIAQLLEADVVLDDGYDISTDAVDVGVNGEAVKRARPG